MIQLKAYNIKMVPTPSQEFSLGSFVDDGDNVGYITNNLDLRNIRIEYLDNFWGEACVDKSSLDVDTDLEVVEPCLLIGDDIDEGDSYYCRGSNSVKVAKSHKTYICDTKVGLKLNDLGWVYSDELGSIEYKSGFIEPIHFLDILRILKNGREILVEVDEYKKNKNIILKPTLYLGKAILYPNPISPQSKNTFYINV